MQQFYQNNRKCHRGLLLVLNYCVIFYMLVLTARLQSYSIVYSMELCIY